MFRDPNEVLSKAIEDQDIESFCTFTLTTTASDKIKGGGIANIGFLEGPPASRNNGGGNAQPVSVTVTYWIETVRAKLTLKPGVSSQQAFQMINKAGVLGPLPTRSSLSQKQSGGHSCSTLRMSHSTSAD
jgi:hypothetical protein